MTTPAKRGKRELTSDRDPWTKQPWESHKAFAAFVRYRDMDPATRTLRRLSESLAEEHPDRKAENIEAQLKDWSQHNLWPSRLEAHTLHMDAVRIESREELHRRIERDDLAMSDMVLEMVASTLAPMHERDQGIPLEMADRWMEKAVRMRRLAAGLSTDNVKAGLVITSQDLSRILNRVIDVACDGFVPPEMQEEFIRRITEEAS